MRAALQRATAGRYEIHDQFGSGGMATVFLAYQIALDRLVAIKVMLPALQLSDKLVECFKRVNHPHIIPVYAVGEKSDLPHFVMKYVAGRNLDGVIRESGPMSIAMSNPSSDRWTRRSPTPTANG